MPGDRLLLFSLPESESLQDQYERAFNYLILSPCRIRVAHLFSEGRTLVIPPEHICAPPQLDLVSLQVRQLRVERVSLVLHLRSRPCVKRRKRYAAEPSLRDLCPSALSWLRQPVILYHCRNESLWKISWSIFNSCTVIKCIQARRGTGKEIWRYIHSFENELVHSGTISILSIQSPDERNSGFLIAVYYTQLEFCLPLNFVKLYLL